MTGPDTVPVVAAPPPPLIGGGVVRAGLRFVVARRAGRAMDDRAIGSARPTIESGRNSLS